jgi:hypothetical protein
MYALYRIDQARVISHHRTLEAVAKADAKLQAMTKKHCGEESYVSTECRLRCVEGKHVHYVHLHQQSRDRYWGICESIACGELV